MSEEQMNAVTNQIINCAYTVSNVLGCGFLEKIYENALFEEMKMSGLDVSQQHNIPVYYKGMNVGNYSADLIVESSVLV